MTKAPVARFLAWAGAFLAAGAPLSLASERAGGDHWSFQPPTRPALPAVRQSTWPRNEIDFFILAELEKAGMTPSAEADRSTLIRRLSLDLRGLPPTVDEVRHFLQDAQPDAYERLVDRLLESPHFGEQWARHWLDLARYADSDGYEKDFYRPHAWRWRDWVIDSINRDEPFDEFTRNQIAGDLLPGASLEQRIATGFHRNTLLNREGGVDIEEDRVKIVVDRISTVSTAWLGLTVGCAECHSHKYDPISQREFYQLYAFFNGSDDRDVRAPLPVQSAAVRERESELTRAKRNYVQNSDAELEAWARSIAALPNIWVTPAVDDYELPTFGANNGANLYPQEDGSFLVTGMIENQTHYIMMLNTPLRGITGIRVEAMTDEMLPKLGPGWAPNGNFVLTELHVESASLQEVNQLVTNRVAEAWVDYAQEGFAITNTIDGVITNSGWAVDIPELPLHGVDRCAVYALQSSIGHPEGTRLKVSLVQHHGKSHTLGRVRVTYTTADPALLALQAVPQRIRDIAAQSAAQRTLDDAVALRRYFQATFHRSAPDFAAYTQVMAASPGVKGDIQAPVLSERARPRPTFVHVRGNFLDRGEPVECGTPAVLHPIRPHRPDGKLDRADLANWLVDPSNPLTARVTVNHFWQHLFGTGLVPTVADFGSQGERASHPELLDWLATEFVRLNWSRKALLRLIASSAAYRQSSAHREEYQSRDAKNRLLSRQNRFRLTAENARDQFLAAGGLLDRTIGGPSVPAQSPKRGMYLQIKRAHIDYLLTIFDAPTTVQACARRERSNTPLQALTLLNGDLFVKSARGLAQRSCQERSSDTDRIDWAVQSCVARLPTEQERRELLNLKAQLQEQYAAAPDTATQLAGTDWPDLPAPEAAAWIAVMRIVLNLDEVITRE